MSTRQVTRAEFAKLMPVGTKFTQTSEGSQPRNIHYTVEAVYPRYVAVRDAKGKKVSIWLMEIGKIAVTDDGQTFNLRDHLGLPMAVFKAGHIGEHVPPPKPHRAPRSPKAKEKKT